MKKKSNSKKHQTPTNTKEVNQTIRIPRPLGLTSISLNLNHKKHKKKSTNNNELYSNIISNYINNNFTINHKALSINQLSTLYNIPLTIIYKHINEQIVNQSSILNQDNILDTQRALLGVIFSNTLRDRALVSEQLQTLLLSQGGQYKSFISGEVNKALDLMLKSNKGIIDLYGLMAPNPKQNTNILITSNPNTQAQEALDASFTKEKALALLQEKGINNLLDSKEAKEALYVKYDIANIPEVKANYKDEEIGPGEPIVETIEYTTHDTRRQDELGISDNADDL